MNEFGAKTASRAMNSENSHTYLARTRPGNRSQPLDGCRSSHATSVPGFMRRSAVAASDGSPGDSGPA